MKQTTSYFAQLIMLVLLSGVFAAPALANPQIMSAPEAQAAVKAGKMILLDIRTVAEWQEDGIAEGAYPLDLTARNFGELLNKILEKRGDKLLGMICATGGRTGYVMSVLAQKGLADIVDVSEGMHGNYRGVGWLRRELPVVNMGQAQQDFDVFMQ